jgi:hypothetical protein
MCVNALYMILLKWELYVSEYALCYIINMRNGMGLSALYMLLLKWDLLSVLMRFIWYY